MIKLQHPCPGARLSQGFGENPTHYAQYGLAGHNGYDFVAPIGTPVLAAHGGTALTAKHETGYGWHVYIVGPQGDSVYGHLSRFDVNSGEEVRAGDVIGGIGYTGTTIPEGPAGAHLHFGWRPKPFALNNGYRGYVALEEGQLVDFVHRNVICPHCQSQAYPDWLVQSMKQEAGWVNYIVLMDPPKQNPFPAQRVIGRHYIDQSHQDRLLGQGEVGGRDFANLIIEANVKASYVHAWRGPNEPAVGNAQQRANLVAFYTGMYERLHAAGIKVVGPELSVVWPGGRDENTPDWVDWIKYDVKELLDIYLYYTDYWSYHAYGRKANFNWTLYESWTLRYRYVEKAIREMVGSQVFERERRPWLLTEGGLDRGGDPDSDGWRVEGPTRQKYAETLADLNLQMVQDNVECYALFGFCETGWPSFAYEEADWKAILAEVGQHKETNQDAQIVDALLAEIEPIPLNENAALYRYAKAYLPECVPISDEAIAWHYGEYVGQMWYDLNTKAKVVVYCKKGDWGNVSHQVLTS